MSSVLENVSVDKLANIYFDGKVVSHKVTFTDGRFLTLGIMQVGEYTFSTQAAEVMNIQAGKVKYRLAGQENWTKCGAGDFFSVPANSQFEIKVKEVTDYLCEYDED